MNRACINPSRFYVPKCQMVKFSVKLTEFNVTNTARKNPSPFYIPNCHR